MAGVVERTPLIEHGESNIPMGSIAAVLTYFEASSGFPFQETRELQGAASNRIWLLKRVH